MERKRGTSVSEPVQATGDDGNHNGDGDPNCGDGWRFCGGGRRKMRRFGLRYTYGNRCRLLSLVLRFEYRCGWGAAAVELHWSQEAISATRNGFDVTRIVSFVGKGVAKFADRGVQASLEIDESVFGPQVLLQFRSGDDLALALREQDENTQRLFLKANARAVFANFARCQVHMKRPNLRIGGLETCSIKDPKRKDLRMRGF